MIVQQIESNECRASNMFVALLISGRPGHAISPRNLRNFKRHHDWRRRRKRITVGFWGHLERPDWWSQTDANFYCWRTLLHLQFTQLTPTLCGWVCFVHFIQRLHEVALASGAIIECDAICDVTITFCGDPRAVVVQSSSYSRVNVLQSSWVRLLMMLRLSFDHLAIASRSTIASRPIIAPWGKTLSERVPINIPASTTNLTNLESRPNC